MSKLWLVSGLAVGVAALAGCNSSPRAMDDSVTVPQGMAVNIPVLKNDVDPDGDPMIVKAVWGSGKGTVAINSDNTIAYTPYAGATGTDTFSYRLKDNHNHAKIADVLVNIEPARPVTVIEQRPRILAVPETSVAAPPSGDWAPPPPPPDAIVTTAPPATVVVPAPAAVVPARPMIQAVQVNLHTTGDDKNREEPVRVVVRRGPEVLADSTIGAGELWGADSDRSVDLTLRPGVPLDDLSRLSIDLIKGIVGSGTGGGWTVWADAQGRLSDGSTVTLLSPTRPLKLGDGAPSQVTWSLPKAP
jgi:hypothetical protein